MFLRKAYSLLLGLYPAEFRSRFAAEMTAVFEQAAARQWSRGRVGVGMFAAKELAGLLAGAVKAHTQSRTCEPLPFPCDIAGAERYIHAVTQRLIHAIANHDFPGARYYDAQDRKARALLEQLRVQSN